MNDLLKIFNQVKNDITEHICGVFRPKIELKHNITEIKSTMGDYIKVVKKNIKNKG